MRPDNFSDDVKMKGIKLIIFDLDGTRINAYPAIIESFNYTLQRLHYLPRDNLTMCRTVGWGDSRLLEPFIKRKDRKKALSLYRQHHQNSLKRKSCLFPKVKSEYFKLDTSG